MEFEGNLGNIVRPPPKKKKNKTKPAKQASVVYSV